MLSYHTHQKKATPETKPIVPGSSASNNEIFSLQIQYFLIQSFLFCGPVVQSVSTPACHAGGRRFEPVLGRHFFRIVPFQSGTSVPPHASVAQLVEQRTENPRVVGSIPTGGTNQTKPWKGTPSRQHASVAHLVERHLAKVEVASSSLVTRSIFWSSFAPFGAIAKW